jgi:hypothetical protein
MAWILLAETQPLAAHHGFAAHTDERVTVRATITEYRFVNPHVQLYFDIESAARELEQAKRIQKFGPIAAR